MDTYFSTYKNPFVLDNSQYVRDINILKEAVDSAAQYISKITKDPIEKTREFVRDAIKPNGIFKLKNPKVLAVRQVSEGNREKEETTFMELLTEVRETNRIMSPTMVVYERPEVKKSKTAEFIELGIAARKTAKREMKLAEIAKDKVLRSIKNAEQNARKIDINSLSGMHGFTGNLLYLKSGHSSLTSMCRSATGYGNSNNEKLLAGARHYWSVDVAINAILTMLNNANFTLVEEVVEKYNLHIPTIEETVECIVRSLELYVKKSKRIGEIRSLVATLSPVERATFVYQGDLYHLRKHNEGFVRHLFDDYLEFKDIEVDNPEYYIDKLDGDLTVLVALLCEPYLKGTSLGEKDVRDNLKEHHPSVFRKIGYVAKHVLSTQIYYSDLIKALWVAPTLPNSVSIGFSMMRKATLAGDTDSNIVTAQDWSDWYSDNPGRTTKGDRAWYLMTYFVTQTIIHQLAMFSKNIGVEDKELNRISMKNEYAFPGFALTTRAKHYWATKSVQEGVIFDSYKDEIKGVALRSSAVPPFVIKRAQELMYEVLEHVDQCKRIPLEYVFKIIYDFELDIERSILKGEYRYLKTEQIKTSYKNLESSKYRYYLLWNQVFAENYGPSPQPPYTSVKVPLDIDNKTEMKEWLASIEDKQISEGLLKFIEDRGKDTISTLSLPSANLSKSGLPKEVIPAVNIRKLTYEILESFYIILETLGFYHCTNSKTIRLVKDFWEPTPSEQAA